MADDNALLTIRFEAILDDVIGRLDDFAADQLPFAMAGALYDVAVKAREEMRRKAPRVFTIRQKKPWAERALTFDRKSKKALRDFIQSGGDPSISIVSKDEVLGPLLTDGGVKRHGDFQAHGGKRYGGQYGIPIIGGARKTKMTIIKPGRNAPSDYLNKGAFIITGKDGRQIMVMPPKKYKPGIAKAKQHKALFHMRKSVNIKPWWDARDILGKAMLDWLPEKFEEACRLAMKTRKAK